MTNKLFYKDGYRKEFTARVISCEETKKGFAIVLDQTAFFPEGGGQYGDLGYLDSVKVIDTREKGGLVYHYTKEALEVGMQVKGHLDWQVRFDRMQQHSGEHIISGIVHKRYGYDNVGFHLADEYCTIDFNGPITMEALKEIEEEANKVVFENLPIHILYPSKEELKDLEYRSKIEIEGQVRIVEIPGVDICACCAPHTATTGEIGLIKLVRMDNYKGGERIYMLSGMRALKNYQIKEESVRAISSTLCAKEEEVALAVEKLKEDQTSLKNEIASLKQKLLSYRAAEISIEDPVTLIFDSELSGNEPREFMNLLLEKGAKVCGIFAGDDEKGYRYVVGSRKEDVRPYGERLKSLGGRGGGKSEMIQGSIQAGAKTLKSLFL